METIDALLQDVPIFHEMTPARLALLAGCAKNVHFDEDAVMFREGEPADTFYGGYAGAFRDLDGHAWEIAHNPGFGLDDDGNIVLPGT